MKKLVFIPILLCTSLMIYSVIFPNTSSPSKDYGVFIGLGPNDLSKMYGYSTIILDASNFSRKDIEILKAKGSKVYSYINIGSIENFRPYYSQFESITLGSYEGWPEERWIDVSQDKWQEYLTNNIASNLVNKGIDGFFVDNLDIYSYYKTEPIYNGIYQILSNLKSDYKLPVIVNGGYEFISNLLNNNYNISQLIDGVNQESVFSSVDFSNNTFKPNKIEDRDFTLSYLKNLQEKKLNIYIIEYTESDSLKNQIQAYCLENNMNYYITSSITLE